MATDLDDYYFDDTTIFSIGKLRLKVRAIIACPGRWGDIKPTIENFAINGLERRMGSLVLALVISLLSPTAIDCTGDELGGNDSTFVEWTDDDRRS